jgi:hypothetical protein
MTTMTVITTVAVSAAMIMILVPDFTVDLYIVFKLDVTKPLKLITEAI